MNVVFFNKVNRLSCYACGYDEEGEKCKNYESVLVWWQVIARQFIYLSSYFNFTFSAWHGQKNKQKKQAVSVCLFHVILFSFFSCPLVYLLSFKLHTYTVKCYQVLLSDMPCICTEEVTISRDTSSNKQHVPFCRCGHAEITTRSWRRIENRVEKSRI